jgi:hypothetical protein
MLLCDRCAGEKLGAPIAIKPLIVLKDVDQGINDFTSLMHLLS